MATANSKTRTNRRIRDKRQKFIWLDQVKADKKLPRSAFVVAFQLMQGFNAEYGGAAWKSIETLAKETGLSEPSIVRITRQLTERGHLKIDPGKPGRGGHSNRYFMVKKTSAGGGLETSTDGDLQTSAQTSARDPQTSASGGDPLKNHLTGEAIEASPVGERESELTLAAAPGAPAPVSGAPEGKEVTVDRFSDLWASWSSIRPHADTLTHKAAGRAAFVEVCRWADPDEVIAAAYKRMTAAEQDNPRFLPKLADWLSNDNWRKPPPPPSKSRRKGGKPALAEMMLRRGQQP